MSRKYVPEYSKGLMRAVYRRTFDVEQFQTKTALLQLEDDCVEFILHLLQRGFYLQHSLPFTFEDSTLRIVSLMPKKNDTSRKIGEWNGIANVPFSSNDKAKFQAWLDKVGAEYIFAEVENLVGSDYKLSLSVDTRSDAFMASLSCYNDADANYKYTMVSRAPSMWLSMAVTVYKHVVLAKGKWDTPDVEKDVWG